MPGFSVGIDLVEFDALRGMERNTRFLQKVFTARERRYCQGKSNPLPFLAARFAAKEAVIKAVGLLYRKPFYSDIEIVKMPTGAVTAAVAGYPGIQVAVSMSHGRHSATAVAIVRHAVPETRAPSRPIRQRRGPYCLHRRVPVRSRKRRIRIEEAPYGFSD